MVRQAISRQIGNLTIVAISVALLNSCIFSMDSHLAPAGLDVSIDEDNKLTFTFNDASRGRTRDYYEVVGLRMFERGCVENECNEIKWVLNPDNSRKTNDPTLGTRLPVVIHYGEEFPHLKPQVNAKPLRYEVPYNISVGFSAYDASHMREIPFSAENDFLIREGDNGKPQVVKLERSHVRKPIVITEKNRTIVFGKN